MIDFQILCFILQAWSQEYHELKSKKDSLLEEATSLLKQQAEAKSVINAKIQSVDEHAETLMGVDDEASDKLFDLKRALQNEMKILDRTHTAVNDEFAQKLATLRLQMGDLCERSRGSLQNEREVFNDVVKQIAVSLKGHACPCKPLKNTGKSNIN